MNAAARLMQKSVLSRSWVISVLLERTQSSVIILILALLMSALSMIYVTNLSRSLHADIQQTLAERNRIHIQWSQLLLEKSTWTMQGRVQSIAEGQLNMLVPDHKSVVIINE